ncbi:MAG: DUF2188 domain-containing protein [Actinobacteria bacterium]|nr:DUF2188 domain-containing protein [Actinomycetota bacterium]
MSKNYHVVRKGDQRAVKREKAERSNSLHGTQKEAIERARELAIGKKGEVVIHRPDGRIRDKDSYGNDPNPPKDNKF